MERPSSHPNLYRALIVAFLSMLSYFLPLPLSHQAHLVLSILVLSAGFWATEVIPLFLTALIASILIVFTGIFSFSTAVGKFADPILVLFFGGFLIARAMQKQELDQRLGWMIGSNLSNIRLLLFALMLVTMFLSMWISNTAASIIMMAIGLVVMGKMGAGLANFGKAMVLGIAYAANIGGMATIIGSPPNAIAVAHLSKMASLDISFLSWLVRALPLSLILIFVAWIILVFIFPPEVREVSKVLRTFPKLNRAQKLFMGIFGLTVALWLTTDFHGLSSSLIAISSATVLFLVGLLDKDDLAVIGWDTLILFGGGLVLGAAMFDSGLALYLSQLLARNLVMLPEMGMLFALIVFSIFLGMFASNTATAAIVVPIVMPLASELEFPVWIPVMVAALAVSLDFLFPVGTPPNAIAYSTGRLEMRDMLKAGSVMTGASILAFTLWVRFLW